MGTHGGAEETDHQLGDFLLLFPKKKKWERIWLRAHLIRFRQFDK